MFYQISRQYIILNINFRTYTIRASYIICRGQSKQKL